MWEMVVSELEKFLRIVGTSQPAYEGFDIIDILSKLSTAYDRNGDSETALTTINDAISLAKETGKWEGVVKYDLLQNRGEIFMHSGNLEDAMKDFTTIIESKLAGEGYIKIALDYRSLLLTERGKYEDALRDLDQLGEEKIPGLLFNRRIEILEGMGKYREALAEIDRRRAEIEEMDEADKEEFDELEERLNDALNNTTFQD